MTDPVDLDALERIVHDLWDGPTGDSEITSIYRQNLRAAIAELRELRALRVNLLNEALELDELRAWKERLAKRSTPEEVADEFIQDGKHGITIAGIICGIKNDILDKQLILYREKIADLIRQDREDE